MISSSYTFNDQLDDYNKTYHHFNVSGCTEYPALNWKVQRHIMMPLYIFSNDSDYIGNIDNNLVKLFGKDYTRKQYMMDYLHMIHEMLNPINERAKENLFELYTFKDYKDDAHTKTTNNSYSKLQLTSTGIKAQNLGHGSGNAIRNVDFADDEVIGMVTHCSKIRKLMKAQYKDDNTGDTKCRKVQLAHTAIRLIYSRGFNIALVALKLYKDYSINPLYALWIAYHINQGMSSDYGDLFTQQNAGFVTYDTFIDRFFDTKLNSSVMLHFAKEEHPLAEYINMTTSDGKLSMDTNMTKFLFGKSMYAQDVINYLSKNNVKEKVDELIKICIDSVSIVSITLKFVFTKKLFSSVALNVSYNGIEIPGSKLGRIIFKDENETALSVLKTSKFINIK